MQMEEKKLVTVDITVFTVREGKLEVLLIQRKFEPFKDQWALPGGFVLDNETLEEGAKRELQEETGVEEEYLEQLYTFGDPGRDPRGRVITIAYLALVKSEAIQLHATTDAKEVRWFPIKDIPTLAFDHKNILDYAIQRLKWKFEYTPVAFSLLPKKFTISELQSIYEIIFEKTFDKRNFRKKLLSLNILKEEEVKRDVSHRPPQLYSLKKNVEAFIELL